jgi:hypothetical protein
MPREPPIGIDIDTDDTASLGCYDEDETPDDASAGNDENDGAAENRGPGAGSGKGKGKPQQGKDDASVEDITAAVGKLAVGDGDGDNGV